MPPFVIPLLIGLGAAAVVIGIFYDSTPPRRRAVVKAALARLGTPYQWAGGHMGAWWGLDCSGLVLQAMRDAGEQPFAGGESTSNGWYHALPAVLDPRPGDLGFYGSSPDRATHVVMVTKFDPSTGVASIVGSNGGDQSTTSPEIAKQQGAMVKEAPTHLFRKDFLGFGRMPLDNEPAQVAMMRRLPTHDPKAITVVDPSVGPVVLQGDEA